MNKISFCTVCMNRLYHLRETLPVNIRENKDFPAIEFVVLDYNSKDELSDWVQSNLHQYMEAGILKYYKTFEPPFFNMSHSKNLISKLASGDIICNVDADNYAGPQYAAWVNNWFTGNEKNNVLTTIRKTHIPYRDQGGKVCFHKELFHSVQGYDESLVGYGIDDVDLVNRMEKAGGSRVFIEDGHYLRCIEHSDEERLKNLSFNNKLDQIYLLASNAIQSRNTVLYLLQDSSFIEVTYAFDEQLKPNSILSYAGWVVQPNSHREGRFEYQPDGLMTTAGNSPAIHYKKESPGILQSFVNKEKKYWKNIAREDKLYNMLVKAYSECMNRFKYSENDQRAEPINTTGWGKGTVYLNFDMTAPIRIV